MQVYTFFEEHFCKCDTFSYILKGEGEYYTKISITSFALIITDSD